MVIVTHELGFAREIGDFNVFMDEGLIVESGDRSLFDTCTNPRPRSSWRRSCDGLRGLIDWSYVWANRGELLHGLLVAVEVAAVALVISVLVGLLLALARMRRPPLTWLATATSTSSAACRRS